MSKWTSRLMGGALAIVALASAVEASAQGNSSQQLPAGMKIYRSGNSASATGAAASQGANPAAAARTFGNQLPPGMSAFEGTQGARMAFGGDPMPPGHFRGSEAMSQTLPAGMSNQQAGNRAIRSGMWSN